MSFGGRDIVVVPDPEPREVRRTWRERLLTRPWRPWRRTRRVTPAPSFPGGDKIMRVGGTCYVSRRQYDAIKAELAKRGEVGS